MNPAAPYRSIGQKIGEISLWTGAGVLVLSAHLAAASLLLQEEPAIETAGAPPAAIMIEMAPEPEAVNTEEEQIAPDVTDSEKVESDQTEPMEEVLPDPPPEPIEPPPQVAEEPPPPEPQPEPEIAEIRPEPLPEPEPVEEVDPIEQQMTAALENVEVPLPTMRPPPPRPQVVEKPEPKKPVEKKPVRRQPRPAQKEMAQAKAQVAQSNRNAASETSTGSTFSAKVSPARWMTRVRAKIARNARRCPGNGSGIVTVRFSFDGSGNIGNVSVASSSGDSAIDNYVAAAVRRASPIPAPPAGVASSLSQPVKCE